MDKFLGKRLDGRYEIKEIIGVGGMAVVFGARDSYINNNRVGKFIFAPGWTSFRRVPDSIFVFLKMLLHLKLHSW